MQLNSQLTSLERILEDYKDAVNLCRTKIRRVIA